MYENAKARIVTDVVGEYFKINRRVKQGDPLSPLLFNTSLEKIFRNLNLEKSGSKIEGKHLNNLRFADDVVLFAESIQEAKKLLKALSRESIQAWLNTNITKMKISTNDKTEPFKINNQNIEVVISTIYLSRLIRF